MYVLNVYVSVNIYHSKKCSGIIINVIYYNNLNIIICLYYINYKN